MVSVVEFNLGLLNFVSLVENHCWAALCSLRDRLCFGFVIAISEMLNLTCSK